MKRLSIIFASSIFLLLGGCATPNTGTYPTLNTSLGEIQDWRMQLYREPGRIDIKMRVVKGNSIRVALETANESEQAPVQLFFAGYDCSSDLDASLRYSTERGVFAYKYFGKPVDRNKDVTLRIEWDEEMRTSVSVDGEMLQVKPHRSFGTLHLITNDGYVAVKELKYSKLTELRGRTVGVK